MIAAVCSGTQFKLGTFVVRHWRAGLTSQLPLCVHCRLGEPIIIPTDTFHRHPMMLIGSYEPCPVAS